MYLAALLLLSFCCVALLYINNSIQLFSNNRVCNVPRWRGPDLQRGEIFKRGWTMFGNLYPPLFEKCFISKHFPRQRGTMTSLNFFLCNKIYRKSVHHFKINSSPISFLKLFQFIIYINQHFFPVILSAKFIGRPVKHHEP